MSCIPKIFTTNPSPFSSLFEPLKTAEQTSLLCASKSALAWLRERNLAHLYETIEHVTRETVHEERTTRMHRLMHRLAALDESFDGNVLQLDR